MEQKIKKVFKESDLEIGVLIRVGLGEIDLSPLVYEGIVNRKKEHAFMEYMEESDEWDGSPINSWRNKGELMFSENGEVIIKNYGLELYVFDSREYKTKKQLIENAGL